MASHEEPSVEVVARHGDGRCHARVSGEIEFDVAPMFRIRVQSLVTPQYPTLVLDVSGVSFCDSSGLGVFVGIRAAALAQGGSLTLTGATGQFARLLQITGLDRLFGAAGIQERPAAAHDQRQAAAGG